MRVRFEWFEPWFNKHNNFFTSIISSQVGSVQLIESKLDECDIEFVGVYPPFRRKINEKLHRWKSRDVSEPLDTALTYSLQHEPETQKYLKRIWYTVENVRPPLGRSISATLSYDQDTYGSTNAYLPIWYQQLGIFGQKNNYINPNCSSGVKFDIESLLRPRKIPATFFPRMFACSFIANPQPTRLRFINLLNDSWKVDIYGMFANKPVKNKTLVAERYRFQICFENDLYPGYVTEKLLDSYVCGNIPIYWGDLGIDRSINRSSFINLSNFQSMEECVISLKQISVEEMVYIYEQPFLTEMPDLSRINALIFRNLS
jgi:hypothetical protein